MLEGNLAEFSLPDIFQLLALTKKSGVLRVRIDGTEGEIRFNDGEVCAAVSDSRRQPLGARLVGAGLLTEQQLRVALDSAGAGGAAALRPLLLDAGTIDEATLDAFAREQIQDAVFDLMRAGEGTFQFAPSSQPAQVPGASLQTEQLITEAARRLGEWAAIRERIPSAAALVSMVPAPPEDVEQVVLSREQWRLLTLVDGARSVRDLVELTGQGEFATCRVLSGLVDEGLVEALEPSSGGQTSLGALLADRQRLRRLEQSEEATTQRPATAAAPPTGAKPARVPAPAARHAAPAARPEAAPAQPETVPAAAEDRSAQPEPAPAQPATAPAQPATAPAQPEPAPGQAEDGPAQPQAGDREDKSGPPAAGGDEAPADPKRRLGRDEDVNKALLLRLIDGVRGA